MDMLENKDTRKRRMPKAGTMVLAAALAVGCALSIAAGLPAQVYNFVSGGVTVVDDAGGGEVKIGLTGEDPATPVEARDGRLWFTADGQNLDITDQVDENTPYVYERTDPATGEKGYVIVGGTADNYGWAEFFLTKSGTCSMVGDNAWDYIVPIDGEDIPLSQPSEEQMNWLDEAGGTLMNVVNRPWLDNAVAQLGLEVELGLTD